MNFDPDDDYDPFSAHKNVSWCGCAPKEISEGANMTIFNDQTKTPDEEAEMRQLKDGVQKAKDRLQEGRQQAPVDEPKPKPKPKGKRK